MGIKKSREKYKDKEYTWHEWSCMWFPEINDSLKLHDKIKLFYGIINPYDLWIILLFLAKDTDTRVAIVKSPTT